MLRRRWTYRLLLCSLCSLATSTFADKPTLEENGVFRLGQSMLSVSPTGRISLSSGAHEMGTWSCLLELEGDERCRTADELLKNSRRTVDVQQCSLIVAGTIQTLKDEKLSYIQKMQAVDQGVRIDVSYTLPDGKDAIGVMQNRRRPFGIMVLSGRGFSGAAMSSRTDAGNVAGRIPSEPATSTINYVPMGRVVKSVSVWHPAAKTGITVAPGPGCYVELLDFRKFAEMLRFNVHPDKDRTSFSQTISFADPLPVSACSTVDVTLGKYDAYLFPSDRPAIVKLQLTNNLDKAIAPQIRWILEPWTQGDTLKGEQTAELTPAGTKTVSVELHLPRRDLYRFTATAFVDGQPCATLRFGVASIVPVPALKDLSSQSHFGYQGHILDRGVTQLGYKWLHPHFNWSDVEPEKGKFNWGPVDEIMSFCKEKGACVIPIIARTPLWASGMVGMTFEDLVRKYSGNPDSFNVMLTAGGGLEQFRKQFATKDLHTKCNPANWQDYRNFVQTYLKRYGDQVTHYEVASEIDGLNSFFGSPEEYVEYLKVSRETVKAFNPKIQVLGIGSYSYTPTHYAKAVFAAGGVNHMDIYHWHPYYEGQGWDVHAREQMEITAKYGKRLPGWATEFGSPAPPKVDRLPMSEGEYDKALQEAAAGSPPSNFFSVGFGAALFRKDGKLVFAPNGPMCLPESEQAKSLIRFYTLLLSEGVEKFTIHSGCSPLEEAEPRAAALSQAMISRTLGEARFLRRIPSESPYFRGYLFSTPEGNAAVCWTSARKETVAVDAAAVNLRVTDLYGNALTPRLTRGLVLLDLTDAPLYLLKVNENLRVIDPVKDFNVTWPGVVFAGDSVVIRTRFQNALKTPVTVRLAVTPPDHWKYELKAAEVRLEPGAKREAAIRLLVPESPDFGLKKMTVELQCEADGLATSQTNTGSFMAAVSTPCPPAPANFVLDGDPSEWRDREPANIDSKTQIVWQTDELLSQFTSLWTGPEDLSARVWHAWQPDKLLVAVEVTDNDVKVCSTPPGTTYLGDCVEFFLDGRTTSYQTEYSKGVYQMLWAPPEKAGAQGYFDKARNAAGVVGAGRRTAAGYTMEAAIPLTRENFPDFEAREGAVFGLNIAIDDLDASKGTTRKIQMTLNGIGRNHLDTSGFTRLRFTSEVPKKSEIVNGGFETAEGNPLVAAGWKINHGEIVSEGAHSGKHCLRLSKTTSGGGMASQSVFLQPDRWYNLRFSYRAQGDIGVSHIRLSKQTEAGVDVIPNNMYSFGSSRSDAWSNASLHVYSGKGGMGDMEIRLHISPNKGEATASTDASLWLDDMELEPLASADWRGEMIENGDFEEGALGSVPPGWSSGSHRFVAPTVTITDKESHSGSRSMQIAVGAPQDIAGIDNFVVHSGARRLEPGRKYALSFWGKAERPVELRAELVGPLIISHCAFLQSEWREFKVPVIVASEQETSPKQSRFMRISFAGALKDGNVKMWVDDVRLVPEVIEDFFLAATPVAGMTPREVSKESHVYRVGRLPRLLLPYGDKLESHFGKLGREYGHIVFDKGLLQDDPTLEWVTPGHPLFGSVRENVENRAEDDLRRGAVFYDLHRAVPAHLDVFSAELRDGRGNVLHERIFVMETTANGTPTVRPPTLFLDLSAAPKGTPIPGSLATPDNAQVEQILYEKAMVPLLDEVLSQRMEEVARVS
ncbi:MAG: hypothetical protein AUJ92_22025 [Armatimonadetes bacterium CG2_30_59_28]|nr:MAG: hypothetical protein AUJ92_22025 [Armatimonadetes bacterium CG2_30_59_28]